MGASAGPEACSDAPEFEEGSFKRVEPCEGCWLTKFDDALDNPAGMAIRRAMMLKAALDCGVTVTLAEIPADEFSALRLVQLEINKRDSEINRRDPQGEAIPIKRRRRLNG
jgi:hypothetical protein